MKKTIHFAVSSIMAVIAIAIGTLGIFYYYTRIQWAIDEKIISDLNYSLSEHIDNMGRVLNVQVNMLESAANYMSISGQHFDKKDEESIFRALLKTGEFRSLAFTDDKGNCRYTDAKGAGMEYNGDEEYWQSVMKTKKWYVSSPKQLGKGSDSSIIIAVPVIQGETIKGVIAGAYETERFAQMALTTGKQNYAATYVVDQNGTIVLGYTLRSEMSLDRKNILERYRSDTEFISEAGLSDFEADIKNGEPGYVMVRRNGELRYVAYAPVGYNDWSMVYIVPESYVEENYAFIHDYTVRLVTDLMVACVIIMFLIIYLYRSMLKEIREKHTLMLKSEERYRILEENSNEAFFEYDLSTHSYHVGGQSRRMFHMPSCFSKEESMELLNEHDLNLYKRLIKDIESGQPLYDIEVRMKAREGDKYSWYRIHPVDVCKKGEPRARIIGKVIDITNQRERLEALIQKSQVDYLTGTYNRESMINFVNGHIQEDAFVRHAFLLFDLNKFKKINDTYGHDVGDEVLISFAALLQYFFRKDDYVGRMGGDEFAVFLANVGDAEQVSKRLEEFAGEFELKRHEGKDILEGCSIGISLYPDHGSTFEELYKCADTAMYEAKRGKVMSVFYKEKTKNS